MGLRVHIRAHAQGKMLNETKLACACIKRHNISELLFDDDRLMDYDFIRLAIRTNSKVKLTLGFNLLVRTQNSTAQHKKPEIVSADLRLALPRTIIDSTGAPPCRPSLAAGTGASVRHEQHQHQYYQRCVRWCSFPRASTISPSSPLVRRWARCARWRRRRSLRCRAGLAFFPAYPRNLAAAGWYLEQISGTVSRPSSFVWASHTKSVLLLGYGCTLVSSCTLVSRKPVYSRTQPTAARFSAGGLSAVLAHERP